MTLTENLNLKISAKNLFEIKSLRVRKDLGSDPYSKAALDPYAYQNEELCPSPICAQTGQCVENSNVEGDIFLISTEEWT